MPIAAEAREISSTTTRCSRKPRPAPPSSWETVGPSTPSSPSRGQSHRGNSSSRSICSAFGASSRSANARTVSRSSSIEMRSPMPYTLRRRARGCRRAPAVPPGAGRARPRRPRSKVAPDDAADDAHPARGSRDVARLTSLADPATEEFVANTAAMRALVDELETRLERGPAWGRRRGDRAPSRPRQAHRSRTHRAARRRRGRLPGAVAARGVRHVRGTGAGGRHRDRHRTDRRHALRDRRERRHREGGHVLPGHGEEARARPGDRDAEPPALRLPRRFRRRLPARCRPRSSPTATTSAASSSTRRACRRRASRRSRR